MLDHISVPLAAVIQRAMNPVTRNQPCWRAIGKYPNRNLPELEDVFVTAPVLVLLKDGNVGYGYFHSSAGERGTWYAIGRTRESWISEDVTHWMPLSDLAMLPVNLEPHN